MLVCTAPPAATPPAAMEERPPPDVMHPPAVVWQPLGRLEELRLQPAPPVVRQPRAEAPPRGDKASERAEVRGFIPPLAPGVRWLAAVGRRALWVCTAPPEAVLAENMEEQAPPLVVDALTAAWLPVDEMTELWRLLLPLVAFRRTAVVLRECRTIGMGLWGAEIPPMPLRPPLRPQPFYL